MSQLTQDNSGKQTQATDTFDPTVPRLEIKRFYVKEQSCKVPYAPGIFTAQGEPHTAVEISNQKHKRDNGEIDVTIHLNISLKINQQTALNLHVEQVGTFIVQGFTKEQEEQVLGAYCPSLLYPYARKVVADLSLSAGFAPINLPPVNFDEMYLQQQENAKNKAKKENQVEPVDISYSS